MDDGGVVVGCLSLHGRQQPVTISELALYLLNESRHQDVEVEDKLNFLKEKELINFTSSFCKLKKKKKKNKQKKHLLSILERFFINVFKTLLFRYRHLFKITGRRFELFVSISKILKQTKLCIQYVSPR